MSIQVASSGKIEEGGQSSRWKNRDNSIERQTRMVNVILAAEVQITERAIYRFFEDCSCWQKCHHLLVELKKDLAFIEV